MRRTTKKTADFTNFYFKKVGLGEGCGCAERVIDVHEFERQAGLPRITSGLLPRKGAWQRFLNKAGLTRRPRA